MKNSYNLMVVALFYCNISFAQTQSEMNATANAKYKKAVAELNKVYKQLMSILDKKEKSLLILAEKDWIKPNLVLVYNENLLTFKNKNIAFATRLIKRVA